MDENPYQAPTTYDDRPRNTRWFTWLVNIAALIVALPIVVMMGLILLASLLSFLFDRM